MSQSGSLFVNPPVGAGVQFLGDGALANNVGPDGAGLIKILGTAGDVTVAYNPGANSLTLSTVGNAAQFLTNGVAPDDIAIPVAGVLEIIGTANQITTSAPLNGAVHDRVVISLTDDVTIPNDLTVTQDLFVNNDVTVTGDITGDNITANGTLDVTGASTTHGINNTGALTTTTATISSFGAGVVQSNGAGLLFSNNGANGQIIIGGGAIPAWANITSPDATIVITNGAATIGLNTGNTVPTQFNCTVGSAIPAAKALSILGYDANITTVGVANSIGIRLANSITLTGNIQANGITAIGYLQANTITSTTSVTGATLVSNTTISAIGNITSTNGNISAPNGTLSCDGLISTNGAITAVGNITGNTVTGTHLVGNDLTLDASVTSGFLLKAAGGLVSSSNGTAGQIPIATATGPQWGTLTAGTGIGIAYTAPNILTITNTGVGATKAIVSAQPSANIPNATGDGYQYRFTSNTAVVLYDALGNFNPANCTFITPTTGIYQFNFIVGIGISAFNRNYVTKQYIFTPARTYRNLQTQTSNIGGPNGAMNTIFTIMVYLTVGDVVSFGVEVDDTTISPSRNLTIYQDTTFFQCFQVS